MDGRIYSRQIWRRSNYTWKDLTPMFRRLTIFTGVLRKNGPRSRQDLSMLFRTSIRRKPGSIWCFRSFGLMEKFHTTTRASFCWAWTDLQNFTEPKHSSPSFFHELFHLYHFQVNPLPHDTDDIPLYRLVWQEGLATYVSHVLNPDASLSDVLLDPRLANEGPGFIPAMATSLLRDLTTTDDLTAGRYLAYRRVGMMPSRMGYLIGYEIVKRAATDHSLADLARLRGNALLELVRTQTQALAAQ